MAYQIDDALADIVFTFGEYYSDFFFYSRNQYIHSQLWQTTRNEGEQALHWTSITKFYSVAFRPGLDVFVAYQDSQGVDRHYFKLPGTTPYERRKGKSDADYHRAENGLRCLDRWITTAIRPQHPQRETTQNPTPPAYASLRLVFGPKRDKLYGNPEPNPWGGCYFARSTARGGSTIWNDLPHRCQESLNARRMAGLNGDPLLMAFGLGGSYVTLWHDLSYDRHISTWYPSLEFFLAQNQGGSQLVDIVLAPQSQDTFYARLYNSDRDVYVSLLRGPIARTDLLALNEALKTIRSQVHAEDTQQGGWKQQEVTVIVTHSQRGKSSRAIKLPEYGDLDLGGVSFVQQAESSLDERLKTGSELVKLTAEVASAAASCLLM